MRGPQWRPSWMQTYTKSLRAHADWFRISLLSEGNAARRSRALLLPEPLDVLGHVRSRLHRPRSLHHHSNLLDDFWIRERGHVADGHPVRDRRENATHDLARARLRHVGNDAHALWPRDFPDQRLELLHYILFDFLARLYPRFQRNINLGNAPA